MMDIEYYCQYICKRKNCIAKYPDEMLDDDMLEMKKIKQYEICPLFKNN